MGFPFNKPGEEATDQAAAPAAPAATAPVAPAAPAATTPVEAAPDAQVAPADAPVEKVRKKHTRTATKEIEQEDINFVIANVRTMSYKDMAESRTLTKYQVNRILMDVKKGLRTQAGEDAEKLAKVEEYIKSTLSRPDDAGVGKKGGGKVRKSLNNAVADILANL